MQSDWQRAGDSVEDSLDAARAGANVMHGVNARLAVFRVDAQG
jgi:hypothetical protein